MGLWDSIKRQIASNAAAETAKDMAEYSMKQGTPAALDYLDRIAPRAEVNITNLPNGEGALFNAWFMRLYNLYKTPQEHQIPPHALAVFQANINPYEKPYRLYSVWVNMGKPR